MQIRALALSLTAALALTSAARAQRLGVGDPAPRILVSEWIKGEPVKTFAEGKPYVVEFWGTWCPPCVSSIPHINEIQKKHAAEGLTIIGVAINERSMDKVRKFVADMGPKMDYRVAVDEANGAMSANWLTAAGQTSVPTAFLVDRKGNIAWIGHPMQMDESVDKLVAGTLDVKAAREEAIKAKELDKKLNALQERLGQAMAKNDFKGAVVIVDEAMQVDPRLVVQLAPLRFDLLLKTEDFERAYAYARKAVKETLWEEPVALNSIAWAIVDPRRTDLKKRDLDLALLVAERLVAFTENKDFGALDTLARVQFTRGEVAAAVGTMDRAIALAAEDPNAKAQLERNRAEFEKALEEVAGTR